MSLQAILFDMDGVIVDTEPLHRKAWFNAFADYQLNVSHALYESFTGKSTQNVADILKEKFELKVSDQELIKTKRAYFKHYFDTDPDFDLIQGVKDLIIDLYQNEVTLILASSASVNTIRWVLEKFELENYFKDKISGATLKKSKPHPEIFEKAAKMAGALPANCIAIEDSTSGITAAKNAHVFTIGFNSEHSTNQDYSRADKVINHFNEINYNTIKNWV